jgi:hypothetical protein
MGEANCWRGEAVMLAELLLVLVGGALVGVAIAMAMNG